MIQLGERAEVSTSKKAPRQTLPLFVAVPAIFFFFSQLHTNMGPEIDEPALKSTGEIAYDTPPNVKAMLTSVAQGYEKYPV